MKARTQEHVTEHGMEVQRSNMVVVVYAGGSQCIKYLNISQICYV